MTKNVNIEVPLGRLNISPGLFHKYAKEYFLCRKGAQLQNSLSPVLYFLVSRAIELELKARHLETKSRDEIKNEYGHDLRKAYDELKDSEKILDKEEYSVLCKASDIYNNKGFEYCTVYDAGRAYKNFPDLTILDRIAEKLLSNISCSS